MCPDIYLEKVEVYSACLCIVFADFNFGNLCDSYFCQNNMALSSVLLLFNILFFNEIKNIVSGKKDSFFAFIINEN